MANDFLNLFKFYIVLLILNLSVLPLTVKLFDRFKDKGAIFGKSLGMYICGYILWLLSSCRIIRFSTGGAIAVVAAVTVVMYSYVVVWHIAGDDSFFEVIKENYKQMLFGEIAFLIFFIFFNWLFAHRVPDFGTERMMDYGFMVSMAKTDYFPAADMWAAGKNINYYYFGQYIFTFMHKLSGVSCGYAYTFGLYTIMAWAMVSVYRLAQSISGSAVAGGISSALVVFGGNFHYIIFRYITPAIREILQLESDGAAYWFADSTRYIGYVPDVANDKTIHEVPAYSFIIGDLHAHVVNMLVVICIIALLWSWFSELGRLKEKSTAAKCFDIRFAAIGFFLAISSMSNYWDFPIYYVVSGSVILAGMWMMNRKAGKTVAMVAAVGAYILAVNYLLSLPFNIHFEKMIQGIALAYTHSRLYQLLILWGFPVVLFLSFVICILVNKAVEIKAVFITLLGCCATGLVLLPEAVFVKDIYIDGFPRANTMFKLTYEASILFGICCGCIIIEFLRMTNKEQDSYRKKCLARKTVAGLICAVLVSGYFASSAQMWFKDGGEFEYKSMEADYNIRNKNSDELGAIDALNRMVDDGEEKQPVVLVASGDSYTSDCSIPVITGCPTVLGWHTHEWLWHNSRQFYEEREADERLIYMGTDRELTQKMLEKYNVKYVYIGKHEYEKYPEIQNGILESLGECVYSELCDDGQMIEIIKIASGR